MPEYEKTYWEERFRFAAQQLVAWIPLTFAHWMGDDRDHPALYVAYAGQPTPFFILPAVSEGLHGASLFTLHRTVLVRSESDGLFTPSSMRIGQRAGVTDTVQSLITEIRMTLEQQRAPVNTDAVRTE